MGAHLLRVAVLPIVVYAICLANPSYAGVVGTWTFEEGQGSAISDASGNGHNGQIIGAGGTWIEGKFGRALALDASTYVEIPDPNGDFVLSHGLTVAAWAYITELPQGEVGLVRKVDTPDKAGWVLHPSGVENGFEMRFYAHIFNGYMCVGRPGYHNPVLPYSTTWHHFAATYDGVALRLYVDGELVGWDYRAYPSGITPADGPVRISNDLLARGRWLSGAVDEVFIADEALSQNEIRRLMEEGVARFIGK